MPKTSSPCLQLLTVVLLLELFPGFPDPSPQTIVNATASASAPAPAPSVDPDVKENTSINGGLPQDPADSGISPSSLPYSANETLSPSYVNGVMGNFSAQQNPVLSNSLPPYSGAPSSPLKLAPAPDYQNRVFSSSISPALSHDNNPSSVETQNSFADSSPSPAPYTNSSGTENLLIYENSSLLSSPDQTKNFSQENPSVSPPTSADIQEVLPLDALAPVVQASTVEDQPESEESSLQQGPPMVNVDVDADPAISHPSVLPFNYKAEDEMLEFHEANEDESWDGMNHEAVTGLLVGLCVVGFGGFVYKVRMNKKRRQYKHYQPLGKRSVSI